MILQRVCHYYRFGSLPLEPIAFASARGFSHPGGTLSGAAGGLCQILRHGPRPGGGVGGHGLGASGRRIGGPGPHRRPGADLRHGPDARPRTALCHGAGRGGTHPFGAGSGLERKMQGTAMAVPQDALPMRRKFGRTSNTVGIRRNISVDAR